MPSQSNVYQNIYYLISRNKQAKKTRIRKSKKSKENKEEKRTSLEICSQPGGFFSSTTFPETRVFFFGIDGKKMCLWTAM